MKRIFATIGAAAIGATTLQQAEAANLSSQESTKPWSVGVALRGFYDDNYLLAPRGSTDSAGNSQVRESFGFEVRPTVGLNIPMEQTYFGLDLTYSGQWYEDRSDDHWDHSFLANAIFNHAFSQRVTLDIQDRFVYSQRPELTDPTASTFIRTDQNNISNLGNVQLNVGLSRRLGLVLGYKNFFIDYENENAAAEALPPGTIFNPGSASLSARLDRIEQTIPLNLRHQTGPSTVTLIGYSFGMTDYTSDEFLYATTGPFVGPKANSRNYRSHYGYLGVEHNFTPVLSLGVRGGAQYSDFYNSTTSETTVTPYGDVSLSYLYTTGSQFEVGYTLSQAATDQVAPDASGSPTLNRLASTLFARVDHQFMPQLHGGLYGQWQLSDFNGGSYDGQNENLYLLGASLRYSFNRFLAADLGYKFDYLDSEISNRGYTRNRVHIGLTATY